MNSVDDPFAISDKVVIITGSAGGVGGEIARFFGRRGAGLVLVDRKTPDEKTVKEFNAGFTISPHFIEADLLSESDRDRIVSEAMDRHGRIDALINNAGVNVRKALADYTSDEWDMILDVNLKSIFFLSNRVAQIMKEQRYGKIVNISSIQGVVSWAGAGRFSIAPYGASKSGLISITRYFALDLAEYNITVNAVCPGFVETPLVQNLKDDRELYEDIISRTPMKRFAKTSEIASSVMFLCSDASAYITGHALLVDGGWTAQ